MRTSVRNNSRAGQKKGWEGPDEKHCWRVLRSRQRPLTLDFVYAVRTTGIFCLPGCSSRLPKRENVRFFSNSKAALAAGFRPCKRCKPHLSPEETATQRAVRLACLLMDESQKPLGLQELSEAVGYSPTHFQRMFKQTTGITPLAYAKLQRTRQVQRILASESSVTKAIYESGYQASSCFYQDAPGMLGMTPLEYQQGGSGQVIHVAFAETDLGLLFMAATAKGVCAIEFGDDRASLLAGFKKRFPLAKIEEAPSPVLHWLRDLVAHLEEPRRALSLPLHVQGTIFQRKVWEALQKIPLGSALTYSELAAKLGQPQATRAVANACAANQLAVAIPCHRVIRADGTLSGYRWGVERKAALLRHEAESTRNSAESE